ncbi:MAG: class I SAM-dependent methyltransferase [Clostridiales bacterium]|nr:class I SAM-dependent methyltransferase [Clostridiales bacterium]
MFTWSEEGIRWYDDAAEWTGHHARIAERLRAYLDKEDEVCDVGCGTGSLSVALAPAVRHITAVDVDEMALNSLRAKLERSGIDNVTVVRSDYNLLPENFCDVVVACSFGIFAKNGASFLKLAGKRLILAKRKLLPSQEGFSKDFGRGNMAYMDEAYLKDHHIPYRIESCEEDFGQPLRSREDAVRFTEHYRLCPAEESMDDFLDRRLISTGDETFPFFLPNPMESCILTIDKKDLL